jgi:hypothetical protein
MKAKLVQAKTSAVAVLSIALSLLAGGALADDTFSTLAGIPAEAMSRGEMKAVEGKLVPCVSEICGGAGGFFSGSPFAGVDIAPGSTGLVFEDVAQAYPHVWANLFPGTYFGDSAALDGYIQFTDGTIMSYAQYVDALVNMGLGGPMAYPPGIVPLFPVQ